MIIVQIINLIFLDEMSTISNMYVIYQNVPVLSFDEKSHSIWKLYEVNSNEMYSR